MAKKCHKVPKRYKREGQISVSKCPQKRFFLVGASLSCTKIVADTHESHVKGAVDQTIAKFAKQLCTFAILIVIENCHLVLLCFYVNTPCIKFKNS